MLLFILGGGGVGVPRRVLFNYRFDEDQAKNFKAPTKTGLKPLEAELQRIEQVATHIITESDHQREREVAHRNTSGTILISSLPNACESGERTLFRFHAPWEISTFVSRL